MTPKQPAFLGDRERRAAGHRDPLDRLTKLERRLLDRQLEIAKDRVDRALADPAASDVDARNAGLRGERNDDGRLGIELRLREAEIALGERDNRAALGRVVGKARGKRRGGEIFRPHAVDGQELGRHAIAEGDRPGLVEEERIDVARRLDGAAGGRDDVEAHEPIHAGDADGREKAADRRRNEADEQRDQDGRGENRPRIFGDRPERDADDQEDDGEAGQQDRQRQFVRRLLPFGALDQRDHPVDEGRARRGGDPHLDEVGEHRRSAGDGRAIAAGLANDRRGLAGDRRFIDGGDALEDLAVAGNDLARFDQHDIAEAKIERVHPFDDAAEIRRIDIALGAGVAAGAAQSVGLRLAAPFGDGLGEIGEQHREPQPGGDLAREQSGPVVGHEIADEEQGHHQRHHFGDEDDRVLRQRPRVELAQRVDRGGGDDLAVEQALRRGFRGHVEISDQKVLPSSIRKCSTIGASDSAGKYCRR